MAVEGPDLSNVHCNKKNNSLIFFCCGGGGGGGGWLRGEIPGFHNSVSILPCTVRWALENSQKSPILRY